MGCFLNTQTGTEEAHAEDDENEDQENDKTEVSGIRRHRCGLFHLEVGHKEHLLLNISKL
jgi:hypothetical protein